MGYEETPPEQRQQPLQPAEPSYDKHPRKPPREDRKDRKKRKDREDLGKRVEGIVVMHRMRDDFHGWGFIQVLENPKFGDLYFRTPEDVMIGGGVVGKGARVRCNISGSIPGQQSLTARKVEALEPALQEFINKSGVTKIYKQEQED